MKISSQTPTISVETICGNRHCNIYDLQKVMVSASINYYNLFVIKFFYLLKWTQHYIEYAINYSKYIIIPKLLTMIYDVKEQSNIIYATYIHYYVITYFLPYYTLFFVFINNNKYIQQCNKLINNQYMLFSTSSFGVEYFAYYDYCIRKSHYFVYKTYIFIYKLKELIINKLFSISIIRNIFQNYENLDIFLLVIFILCCISLLFKCRSRIWNVVKYVVWLVTYPVRVPYHIILYIKNKLI
jgi:hypothetical protein